MWLCHLKDYKFRNEIEIKLENKNSFTVYNCKMILIQNDKMLNYF